MRKIFAFKIMQHPFWMVSAFTAPQLSGNPAAVFVVEEFWDASTMQAIARELNWSQVAFVRIDDAKSGKAHIRWFSPRDENKICGHATMAAASVLWREGLVSSSVLTLNSNAGALHIAQGDDNKIIMNFPAYPVRQLTRAEWPDVLSHAFVVSNSAVNIESVYADDAMLMVVCDNEEVIYNILPDIAVITQMPYRAVCVTAPVVNRAPFDFCTRYFAPRVGIPEDPVCGSSYTRLGPFWANKFKKSELLGYSASEKGGSVGVSYQGDRVLISGYTKKMVTATFDLSQLSHSD